MTTAFKGPFPNVSVTISVQVDSGPVITKTVNLPNTSVFNVTQQAILVPPTDLRTAQRSLSLATDPRLEVREDAFPGYTVAIVDRAIQQETAPDSWAVLGASAVAVAGTQVRFRARVQVYDETGAAYEAPVDLYSAPQAVVAHVAPGSMAADSIDFTQVASPSGTEAPAVVVSYPAAQSSSVVGFDYSIDAGATISGSIQKPVGSNVTLILAATPDPQVVHVRARDADGAVSASWTQLTEAAVTSVAAGGATFDIVANRTTLPQYGGISFSTANHVGFGDVDTLDDLVVQWDFGDPQISNRHFHYTDMPFDRVYLVDGQTRIVRYPNVYDASGVWVELCTLRTKVFDGETIYVPEPATGTVISYQGTDLNRSRSPWARRAWLNVGTFTVTCRIWNREMIEGGLPPAVKTIPITVNPLTDYVDPSRIYHILGGATSGTKLGPSSPTFQTYPEAWAAATAVSNEQALPVIFAFNGAGEHLDMATEKVWPNNKPLFFGLIGYNGIAAVPSLPGFEPPASPSAERIIHGIDLLGRYDAAAPYSCVGLPGDGIDIDNRGLKDSNGLTFGMVDGTPPGYLTLSDVRVVGKKAALIATGSYAQNIVISDVFVSDWHEYACFVSQGVSHSGLFGVWFVQNPLSITGTESMAEKYEKRAPYIADHGTFRTSRPGLRLSIEAAFLDSRNSWSGEFQPVLRLGGISEYSPIPGADASSHVNRIVGMNGGAIGNNLYSGGGVPETLHYAEIIEWSPSMGGGLFGFRVSGTDAESVVSVVTNSKSYKDVNAWVTKKSGSTTADVLNDGIALRGMTLVDLQDDTNSAGNVLQIDPDGELASSFGYFYADHNIEHIPNRTGTQKTAAPIDLVPILPSSLALKYRRRNMEAADASYAVPAGNLVLPIPAVSSPAIGVARVPGRWPMRTLFGELNSGATINNGAL